MRHQCLCIMYSKAFQMPQQYNIMNIVFRIRVLNDAKKADKTISVLILCDYDNSWINEPVLILMDLSKSDPIR